MVFKNCIIFPDWIREINNIHVDNAKDQDGVMALYIFIEYNDNYPKTSRGLWQCSSGESDLDNVDIAKFNANIAATNLFKLKEKMKGQTGNNDKKDAEIMVTLKYLSNFWRTLEMPLINYQINLILPWSAILCDISNYHIRNNWWKTLCSSSNFINWRYAKLLQQLKSGFKRKINWDKYQSEVATLAQNQYLENSVDPGFEVGNRLFVLSFENNAAQANYKRYCLPQVEILLWSMDETFSINQ